MLWLGIGSVDKLVGIKWGILSNVVIGYNGVDYGRKFVLG